MLPSPAERDPERQEDQPQVEPEALVLDVNQVVFELVAAWDVARRVDLRDTGQARAHAVALDVAGNRRHVDVAARAVGFDLSRPQGARTDEAHVAAEDVPELRQLVERRRA